MASLVVEIEYADLPFISDRTARSILKDLSKAVRKAHNTEVSFLLGAFEVGRRDRQSITDRLRKPIEEGAVYYVEELRSGSLWSKVTISALGIWLLSATVGETIKDAWKESQIHKGIIKYVKNGRPQKFAEILSDILRDRELLTGRAHVFNVSVQKKGEDTVIKIFVASGPDADIEFGEKIEDSKVVEKSKSALEKLHPDEGDKDIDG